MLIAIGHIIGSILATLALGAIVLVIAAWETRRNEKLRLEEMAIRVGVPVDDLGKQEFAPKLIEIASQRYSSDLLSNRLSDLCGVLRTLWDGIGSLLQIGVLLGIVWYTVTDSIINAAYAWFVPIMAIFFWLAGVIFALTCRLLTGRYPSEAKQARKAAAEYLKLRHTSDSQS
jgi:hypothetical protein